MRRHLELQVALETLPHVLTDEQLAEVLQVGQAVEKQDALNETIGMLHLIDRLFLLVRLQALQTPMTEHARVQEILVDRRELVFQHDVQMPQYFGIALHAPLRETFKLARSWANATWRATKEVLARAKACYGLCVIRRVAVRRLCAACGSATARKPPCSRCPRNARSRRRREAGTVLRRGIGRPDPRHRGSGGHSRRCRCRRTSRPLIKRRPSGF